MQTHYIYFLSLFIFACGGTTSNEEIDHFDQAIDTIEETAIDTLKAEVIAIPNEIAELLKNFRDTFELPLTVDSTFIQERNDGDQLESSQFNYQTVRDLIQNGFANGPAEEQKYMLNATIEIDSLKSINAYEDYLSSIDIGMLQDVVYNGHGIIIFPNNRHLLIWTMNYSSYKACPYYTGTVVFGTLLDRYQIMNTIELAEITSSGDPPAFGETAADSEVSEDKITTKYREAYGETADPEYGYEGSLEESDSKHIVFIDSTGFAQKMIDN